jgi:hypothetical protein
MILPRCALRGVRKVDRQIPSSCGVPQASYVAREVPRLQRPGTPLPTHPTTGDLASLALRYSEVPVFPPERRELARALAHQVALALELTRLPDAAALASPTAATR